MLRVAFLFFVVIGAIALVLGIVLGMGMWHAARMRPTAPTPTDVAQKESATRPAASPSAQANSSTPPGAPAKPAVAKKPASVVLSVADATLHGENLRIDKQADKRTAVNWIGRSDAIEWTVDLPKSGAYEFAFEYACDPKEGGGGVELVFAGGVARGMLTVQPTASWQDFQTIPGRTILLPEGKVSMVVAPVFIIPGRQLMKVRSVRVTLVREMDVPTFDRTKRGRFRGGF